MTSANTIYFYVLDKTKHDTLIATYHQNLICKPHVYEKLAKHVPEENFNLEVVEIDEEENSNPIFKGLLKDYLAEHRQWIKDRDDARFRIAIRYGRENTL